MDDDDDRLYRPYYHIDFILPDEGTRGPTVQRRTHKRKVVISSPATANMLRTWVNHFTLLVPSTRTHLVLVKGNITM